MFYVDSHAHLTSNSLYENIEGVLERAQYAGISSIVNICTDALTLERGLSLRKKFPWIYNAAAVMPHDVEKKEEAFFHLIEQHAAHGDLIAIGETGLDYHYYKDKGAQELQKKFLLLHLNLAVSCHLPVIIHCREAFEDLFRTLDKACLIHRQQIKGVLHCFTGNESEAKELISRGWHLSFSGIVTFKKSEDLRNIAKLVPLNQLLVETDSPYLAPQSRRSKMNEPSFLPETIEMIALVKNISIEEVAQASMHNAWTVFNFDRNKI